jgi:hypothetical protein
MPAEQIATLKVEIQSAALKKIVDEGKLLEFAETYSEAAAQELKAQLMDSIAKTAVGSTKAATTTQLQMNFVFDEDEFGTVPHRHWPWGTLKPGSILQRTITEVVEKELGKATVNVKTPGK